MNPTVEPTVELLAIVEVEQDERVRCQAPRCGHSVYKRIHVVKEGPNLKVYGSDCFGQLFGHRLRNAKPRHGGSEGRLLSDEERLLLLENTAALLERFEAELRAEETARHVREQARRGRQRAVLSPSLEIQLRLPFHGKAVRRRWALEHEQRFRTEADGPQI